MAYVRTRLGRFFYEERGKARDRSDPAIVLMHGLLFDSGSWRGQIEPLAELGRVVSIDGPGHGRSEPPPRFVLEEHADSLIDVFGDLGIENAVIVGLSWGGMTAMRFALQHPTRVRGLVLLDADAEAPTLAEKIRYRAFVALHRRVGFPYSLYAREVAPLLFGSRTLETDLQLVEAAYRRTQGFDRTGLAKAALAVVVHRSNVLDRLGAIGVPTLVLVGSEDRSTPVSKSEKMARAIPSAELVVLDRIGHMSALEDPAAVNAHLVPFVRSILRADRSAEVRA